jgi:hypothetical protein
MAARDTTETEKMFEYLRDDIKELGAKLDAKMDRNNDLLSKHISDDSQNFSSMDQRLTSIEATQRTKDQLSEKSATLRMWLIPLLVSIVMGVVVALITRAT